MGRLFTVILEGRTYRCRRCGTHLAQASDLESKRFTCKTGKAFLFASVVNVRCGQPGERLLSTGRHICADTCCVECGSEVGWYYVEALERSQKYKEGKYILGKAAVVDQDCQELPSDTDE